MRGKQGDGSSAGAVLFDAAAKTIQEHERRRRNATIQQKTHRRLVKTDRTEKGA